MTRTADHSRARLPRSALLLVVAGLLVPTACSSAATTPSASPSRTPSSTAALGPRLADPVTVDGVRALVYRKIPEDSAFTSINFGGVLRRVGQGGECLGFEPQPGEQWIAVFPPRTAVRASGGKLTVTVPRRATVAEGQTFSAGPASRYPESLSTLVGRSVLDLPRSCRGLPAVVYYDLNLLSS